MKAIRVNEFGNASVLRYEEVSLPEPQDGEVLVKIDAAGVNFIDIYQRNGSYSGEVPFTPGMEGAGVVEKVGLGVSEVNLGDRVA